MAEEESLTSLKPLHPLLSLPAFISCGSCFVSFQDKAFSLKSILTCAIPGRVTESLSALTDKLVWEWFISINSKYEIQHWLMGSPFKSPQSDVLPAYDKGRQNRKRIS